MDLMTVTQVNEHYRRVISATDQLSAIAMNAMFISRRSSSQALGFAQVTKEISHFSNQLLQKISRLRQYSSDLAITVALSARQDRIRGLITQANQTSQHQIVRLPCQISLQEYAAIRILNKETRYAINLIGIGVNLVILAKVEAEAIDDHSKALENTVTSLGGLIDEIDNELNAGLKLLAL